ncbi:MAG: isoprenylcysteine carboxylmethyltransferase family protein [Ignavibacteria bacterium]|nr:isoprenylcysteine carboxylmethyltransferase family protein [Ignavibacteria bacterium]
MEKTGNLLFKYRSYTPIPFLILMLLFMKPVLISIIAGLLISLCGEIIRIWAVGYAGSETRTTAEPGGSNLVTQGPYGIIRNPLYAGNILIYTGAGIMSFALFPYLQIAGLLYFIFQYYCIIVSEEVYLNKSFRSYEIYKKYVNRFFPSFKKIPDDIKSKLEFDIKAGLKSEKRSLQALFLVSLIIIIYFVYSITK